MLHHLEDFHKQRGNYYIVTNDAILLSDRSLSWWNQIQRLFINAWLGCFLRLPPPQQVCLFSKTGASQGCMHKNNVPIYKNTYTLDLWKPIFCWFYHVHFQLSSIRFRNIFMKQRTSIKLLFLVNKSIQNN